MPSLGDFITAILFVGGGLWIAHVVRDLPRLVKELRDPPKRVGSGPAFLILGLTGVIALWMLFVLVGMFQPLFGD